MTNKEDLLDEARELATVAELKAKEFLAGIEQTHKQMTATDLRRIVRRLKTIYTNFERNLTEQTIARWAIERERQ